MTPCKLDSIEVCCPISVKNFLFPPHYGRADVAHLQQKSGSQVFHPVSPTEFKLSIVESADLVCI